VGLVGVVLVGVVLGGTVLGGTVLGGTVLGGTVLGGTVLGGTVLGGTEAGEEDTPAGMGLFGVGTAAQAVRADAAPITARTVRAGDNLSIGKLPF
jgi:hypothetical protein